MGVGYETTQLKCYCDDTGCAWRSKGIKRYKPDIKCLPQNECAHPHREYLRYLDPNFIMVDPETGRVHERDETVSYEVGQRLKAMCSPKPGATGQKYVLPYQDLNLVMTCSKKGKGSAERVLNLPKMTQQIKYTDYCLDWSHLV